MRHAAQAHAFFGLAAVGILAGCPDRTISPVEPVQGRLEAKDIPVKINRDVDILFVIDDSPSMADKQRNLADNFKRFIAVLETIQGGLPNVHIGVVTSDLGTLGGDGVQATQIGGIGKGGCAGVGKGGLLQLFGANTTGSVPYLSDIRNDATGQRIVNYDNMNSSLDAEFQKMAKAGAGGCGFEQHFAAMKRALLPSTTPNAGFLRPDAFLAVIFIADEDDCSMEHTTMLGPESAALGPPYSFRCTRFGVICDDGGATSNAMNAVGRKDRCHPAENSQYLSNVSEYVTFLKGLKPTDPRKVIVAGIIGPAEPVAVEIRAPDDMTAPSAALARSCSYTAMDGSTEVAEPGVRLKFFLDQFPNRSTSVDICQRDLRDGLRQVGDLLKTVIGNPCIEGKLADADARTAGLQAECAVSAVTSPGLPAEQKRLLEKCDRDDASATNKPCWHLVSDPVNCKADPGPPARRTDQVALKIEGQDSLPTDTHVLASCVTEDTSE